MKQAEATLNGALQLPVQQATHAAGLMDALPAVASPLEKLLAQAQQTRGLVCEARLAVQQAEAQVRLARSQRSPTLALTAAYDETSGAVFPGNTSFVNLVAQLPLIDYGTIRNQVRENQHTVLEKQNNLGSTLESVDVAVRSAYETYQGTFQNASVFASDVLAPSQELVKMTQAGYEQGLIPFLQILNAEQTLRQARLQYAQLLLTGRQALDALEAAVGAPF
ncbi:MAG: TolC family protein [Candidatus Xenobia bacterium]